MKRIFRIYYDWYGDHEEVLSCNCVDFNEFEKEENKKKNFLQTFRNICKKERLMYGK